MSNEQRIKALFSATPDQLAAVDAALAGQEPAPPADLRLLRICDAARQTSLSRFTIMRAIKDGHLKAVGIRAGSRRIPLVELQKFVFGRSAGAAGSGA